MKLCTVRILGIPEGTANTNELPAAARKLVCDFLGVSNRLTRVPVYASHDHLERTEHCITLFVDLLADEHGKESLQDLAKDLNLLALRFAEFDVPNLCLIQTIVQVIGGGGYGYEKWEAEP